MQSSAAPEYRPLPGEAESKSHQEEVEKLLPKDISRKHSITSATDADQKYADDCDALVKNAASHCLELTTACIAGCCVACCMQCEKCIKAMCETIGTVLNAGAHTTNSLIVQPVYKGVTAFLRDENGEIGLHSITQPIVDALMTTVGNPVAVLLDTMFSTNKSGTLRCPTMSPIGRGKQFFQLLSGTLNPEMPGLNRVAAITGLSTALLLGLTYIGLVHGACEGGEALALSRMLTPYGGYKAIADMLQSNPATLHKVCVALAAYVGFTNGLIIGERAVLHDAQAKLREFWAQVKKDDLEHNIDAQIDLLAQHDAATAEQAHSLCCTADKTAKAWTTVHATGQVIGNLLSIPAAVLQIGRVTQHITSVKDWRLLNGLKQSGRDAAQQMREKASSCASSVVNCLGWKTKPTAAELTQIAVDDQARRIYDSYDGARARTKEQLSIVHDAKTAVVGVFKKNYDGREVALQKELKENYLEDVVRFHTGQPLSAPAVMADAPPPAYNPEFAKDSQIQSMLNGEQVNIEHYQQVKYAVFHGQTPPTQQVYATAISAPAYSLSDPSAPASQDKDKDRGAGLGFSQPR